MTLSLAKALRAQPSSCIAFIGAGGKSTAMFTLARGLSSLVIVTATTHLGAWQTSFADTHIVTNDSMSIEQLDLNQQGVILITGEIEDGRTKPVNGDLL
ncbi:MAG TPA: hypothetical protein VJ972_03485, partial [Anaerolineales bacterium]|nr:hypothetical protein [Anaerolineales bacterium]